jgi:HAD superfamily hydrolase (TIGR01509 family)
VNAMLKAMLWDVDGTLAETERDAHRVAFNQAFEALGLPWRWDEARYGELLRITGGRERLLHDMASHRDAPVPAGEREQLARELHARKRDFYTRILDERRITLRPGVAELIEEAAGEGVAQAIVTTTSASGVDALLRIAFGPQWRKRFAAVICGEDVRDKKPHPEAYERGLAQLSLQPLDCVAIEDSPGGAAAARAASVPVIVTRSHYFMHATIDGAIAIGPGLHTRDGWLPPCASSGAGRVTVDDVRHWCAQMESVSQFG